MEIKYQFFISSTYKDLINERNKAMMAIISLGHIPTGMELFPASNIDVWEIICKSINLCNYYLLIIGGRYGTIKESESVSYTEFEYNYAKSIDKPVLVFIKNNYQQFHSYLEQNEEIKSRLDLFVNNLISDQTPAYWSTDWELHAKITQTITTQVNNSGKIKGWVKEEDAEMYNSEKILKLQEEINELNTKLTLLSKEKPLNYDNLKKGDDKILLYYTIKSKNTYKEHKLSFEISWNEIFKLIGSKFQVEADEIIIKNRLRWYIDNNILSTSNYNKEDLIRDYNYGFYADLIPTSFDEILIQFRALNYITISSTKHSIKDKNKYWSLTSLGEQVLMELIAKKNI